MNFSWPTCLSHDTNSRCDFWSRQRRHVADIERGQTRPTHIRLLMPRNHIFAPPPCTFLRVYRRFDERYRRGSLHPVVTQSCTRIISPETSSIDLRAETSIASFAVVRHVITTGYIHECARQTVAVSEAGDIPICRDLRPQE